MGASVEHEGAIAEVKAVARQSPFMLHSKRWQLSAPTKILIGSEPGCDWVVRGASVLPRECLLRWDGRLLTASSFDGDGAREVILEPNAPLQVGHLELLLTPLTGRKPRRSDEDTQRMRRRAPVPAKRTFATSGELSVAAPTRTRVPAGEPTVVIDPTLVGAVPVRRGHRRILAVAALPLVVAVMSDQRLQSSFAHLLAPAEAQVVSRDRASCTRRLIDEATRELKRHPELSKSNIFIGEMLYRAGFIPPGAAWFDVVPQDAAAPGDLVLHAEHGQVEIIRDIVYEKGSIKSISTVGAGSTQLSPLTTLVRPRLR
jgi:hypothetical protein